jgi:hypothetical protein
VAKGIRRISGITGLEAVNAHTLGANLQSEVRKLKEWIEKLETSGSLETLSQIESKILETRYQYRNSYVMLNLFI